MSLMRARNMACTRAGRFMTYRNTRMLSATAFRADKPVKSDPSAAPTTPLSESTLIRKETPAEALTRHQPDYDATIDHGTSKFSPVPKRVMDGSEPGETVPAAVLSGAPTDLQARTVRIFRPSKPATQSGDWHTHHWRMDWDILQKGHRWENPLMGWQSSADCMQGTHLNFKSKEDAILFAQKQGYEYFVQEPNERKFVPKAYANNFVYENRKLKHIRTK
ncbi:ETC complex I subunit conserved region-domain-containing protein [Aspergillus venezuelensis]